MTILRALFGGMALLLYGIRQSGEALQRAAGSIATFAANDRVLVQGPPWKRSESSAYPRRAT